MANYNKSFNFRNGVQVDNDNFVVNTAGLVGIGTSIPSAFLDVYGTSNLRGDVSATGNVTSSGITSTQYLNVVGFSTLQSLSAVGGNYSGVVTATKYFGDGSALSGVFAVSASGWYFEPGSPGVAYTTSKVGIGTTNAETFLQIGGDEVDSNTELRLGKRVTATETSFPAIAQVSSTGSDNSLGLSARTPLGSIIFYTGNGTWGSGTNTEKVRIQSGGNVGIGSTSPTERLDVRGTTRSTILNITGVSTFTGDVSASGNLNVTGVTTFNQDVKFPGAAYNVEWDQPTSKFKFDDNAQCVFGTASGGDLRIFHAGGNSTIKNETGQFRIAGNDIRLQTQDNSEDYLLAVDGGSVSIFHNDVKRLETSGIGVTVSDQLDVTNVSASGVVTATSFTGNVTGNVVGDVTGDVTANGIGVTSLNVTGVSTLTGNVTVGGILDVDGTVDFDDVNVSGACTITGITKVTGDIIGSGNLGLGTSPQTDIHIKNAVESAIVFGRSGSVTGTNASLRFGTSNGSFPYSANTPESLDIINYGKGNVNFYLEAGTTGLGTGGFFWHRRSSFDQLMVLTYDAKLGIGITVPDNTFHVVGTSTVTDNAWFGLNVNVANNLTAAGVGSFGSLFVPAMTTELTGNVNATTGISTFNELKVTSHTTFDGSVNGGVGIGTTSSGKALIVGTSIAAQFHVTNGGEVGIQTNNNFPGIQLDCARGTAIFGTVGAGTSNPQSGADFGAAGFTTSRHMILPKVTTTQRGNLNGVANGSIIYNTSTNKFQGRANGAWVDLH